MSRLTVKAVPEALEEVQTFVEQELEAHDCPMRSLMQISVVVEEVFINIASYAYAPGTGSAEISCEVLEEPRRAVLEFRDGGKPFDPLAQPEIDVALPAEERQIGGLGILLVKKSMDEVTYRYQDGKNSLKLIKKF